MASLLTVNAGRENPTAPAGNCSQHAAHGNVHKMLRLRVVPPPPTAKPHGAVAFYLHLWLLYKLHNTITAAIVGEWPPHM